MTQDNPQNKPNPSKFRRRRNRDRNKFKNRNNNLKPSAAAVDDVTWPSAALLQEYEYIEAGATAKILKMVEAEQKFRHSYEKYYLRSRLRSFRLGQYIGGAVLLSFIYLLFKLFNSGNSEAGIKVAIAGFAAMICSAIFGSIMVRVTSKNK